MSRLPKATGKEILAALQREGFVLTHVVAVITTFESRALAGSSFGWDPEVEFARRERDRHRAGLVLGRLDDGLRAKVVAANP